MAGVLADKSDRKEKLGKAFADFSSNPSRNFNPASSKDLSPEKDNTKSRLRNSK
jgi:hypothetical protein